MGANYTLNRIAIIIPVLNEAEIITDSLKAIAAQLVSIDGVEFSFVVVDDGSVDNTVATLNKLDDQIEKVSIQVISLVRHYGKEAAIFAGLDTARSFDAAIVMDCDLQHPPQLIPEMVKFWRRGSLVVEGVKNTRGNETWLRGLSARIYYTLFHILTGLDIRTDTDFKLIDRKVVEVYCQLPETNRFFRGLIKWMGVPTTQIPFNVQDATRSQSSWPKLSLVRYAISSISSFTSYPLQIVTLLGIITFLFSLVVGSIALLDKLTGQAVDGFTTVILLILFIGSALMFSLGLIGIYLGRIFEEVKRRPNFILDLENDHANEKDDND